MGTVAPGRLPDLSDKATLRADCAVILQGHPMYTTLLEFTDSRNIAAGVEQLILFLSIGQDVSP
jgi:O-acetylhomoserine/O-acetylserine sulfhydrylase-like pyridoxal-dependent enzyme